MLGKIIGGYVGGKVASRYGSGGRGAIVGALAPVVVRRAFGPLGLVVGGAWLGKKWWDRRRARRAAAESRL